MKRTIALCVALGFALAAVVGCSRGTSGDAPSVDAQTVAPDAATSTDDAEETAEPEVDDSPLTVDDPESPEGAVNAFFNSFFTGDAEGAFAMLSARAQASRRDQFVAQSSATVRWRISRKMKPFQGRVYVLAEVEDYTDSGELQSDALTFVLTNDEGAWRIAGFSVGGLAINFEDRVFETAVQNVGGDPGKKVLMTARRVEPNLMR